MMDYFTTSFNPSGNRWIDSCGPSVNRLLQPLVHVETYPSSQINWILGGSQGLDFLVVTASHRAFPISFDNRRTESFNNSFEDMLLSTRPPAVSYIDDDELGRIMQPIVPPCRDCLSPKNLSGTQCPPCPSLYSATVPTPDGGFMFVTDDESYQLVQVDAAGDSVTLPAIAAIEDPLKDAHIVFSKQHQRWAVYTGATLARYQHGILGDFAEGYRVHILKWNSQTTAVEIDMVVELEGDDMVFEGLGPLWADIDGDGIDDLLTTVSKSGQGSQLRAYIMSFAEDESGVEGLLVVNTVESSYIGGGLRWRHQIAVGPFGPEGEIEIVETQTPHIGGIVQFHRFNAELSRLELVARTQYFTSHDIDSRNVDMAIVGDFNGDGIPEVVMQRQDKSQLVGLQRSKTGDDGMSKVWSVDIPYRLISNLGGVACMDGRMELLLATSGNRLMRLSFLPICNETVSPTTRPSATPSSLPSTTVSAAPSFMSETPTTVPSIDPTTPSPSKGATPAPTTTCTPSLQSPNPTPAESAAIDLMSSKLLKSLFVGMLCVSLFS